MFIHRQFLKRLFVMGAHPALNTLTTLPFSFAQVAPRGVKHALRLTEDTRLQGNYPQLFDPNVW